MEECLRSYIRKLCKRHEAQVRVKNCSPDQKSQWSHSQTCLEVWE